MVQPLPAFQKRWMPVATMVSPSIVIRNVSAGPFECVASTGWNESAPVDVSCDRTRSPTAIDSIFRGPPMRLNQGAGGEAGMHASDAT